jgi:hypothetical protein
MEYYYLIIPCTLALISAAVGLVYYNSVLPSLRLLILEAVMSFSSDITAYNYPDISGVVHNIFLVVDTLLILKASETGFAKKTNRKINFLNYPIFISSLFYFIWKYGVNYFANFSLAISSLMITINYLVLLYQSELQSGNQHRASIRLICLAIVMYHCGTFVFFCGIPYLMDDNIPEAIIDINTVFDSIKYLLIAIAFYLFKSNKDSKVVAA